VQWHHVTSQKTRICFCSFCCILKFKFHPALLASWGREHSVGPHQVCSVSLC
jgi:hypothetical protein